MKQFFKWRRVAGALALMVLCRPVPAQPPAPSPNRVLFVVQTSWAMRQQLPAARACVRELLGSGLQGQLHAGDTIGLWTYDSELRAGNFQMQIWADEQRGNIVEATGYFLDRQKATGSARLELALPEVLRLVGESEVITVLLISDGRGTMRGTPFDDSINEVWRQHWNEMQAAHMPFVTVLAGRAGKIVNCNVNPATAVSVPVLPQGGEAKPAPAPTPPAPAPLPVKTNPPLIVDYSKSNLTTVANPTDGNPPPSHPAVATLPPPHLTSSAPVIVTLEPKLTPPPEVKGKGEIPATSPSTPPPGGLPKMSQAVMPAPKVAVAPAQGRARWVAVFMGGAALGLVWWLFTRKRAGSRTGGSLITKSFDQNKR